MFFTKFPHRANFSFARNFDSQRGTFTAGATTCALETASFQGDVYRLRVSGKHFGKQRQLAELTPPPAGPSHLTIGTSLEIDLPGLLCGAEGEGFGISGNTYLFQFALKPACQFLGMGEKFFGRMELSGLRSKFWNTDVWSDFHYTQWLEHPSDPPYLSIPYVIVKQGDTYLGLLLNTPWPAFIETPGNDSTRVFVEWQRTSELLTIGAEGGVPELWILVGPTLKELTRKLQKLVGVTPLPPLWSLGYHQSRWEYATAKDLLELDDKFTEHDIPCDGLWLDIDYMDGFRVFSVKPSSFPKGVSDVASRLQGRRRTVPILDPGVKRDPSYPVYASGQKANVFCKNPEGGEFVGLVWPGESVFPDFTLPRVRRWWGDHVRDFAKQGFDAAWLDMNDPSTGPVDPTGMLFNGGRESHAMHRNEYALGMQMATFDGFRRARPKQRPFLLSRSGSIGTSRYAAVWTGDNVANTFYLKAAIPTTLNLSLSGIPFNGPDCGGFGGDPSDRLMIDWFKAGFLFPFLRNHSVKDSRLREPWNFKPATAAILKKYIELRYKLLPYLYNLYAEHETNGDPILRPLAYEFPQADATISDAFLVGPSILQAPLLDPTMREREVPLPQGPWYDANSGTWTSGAKLAKSAGGETPFFIRNGSVIPMAASRQDRDLRFVELHVFVDPATSGTSQYTYVADDGETYDYLDGKRSALQIGVKWSPKALDLSIAENADGYGHISFKVIVHSGGERVAINDRVAETRQTRVALTGKKLMCRQVV